MGPVGRTRQGKTFLVRNLYSLVVLFCRQVDDIPPWAKKHKKDSNATQKIDSPGINETTGGGLQKPPPRDLMVPRRPRRTSTIAGKGSERESVDNLEYDI